MKFADLEIHEDLKRAAADANFTDLTPIQEKCLFPALEGRDIAGVAQTGTGKTAAFLLPILHKLRTDENSAPGALIVAPTRELCIQIKEEAERLGKYLPFQYCAIFGGENYQKQEAILDKNPEIIAATPGRLIDYLKQGKINTANLRFLVLDEADRMFDMGFIRDIRYIMKSVPDNVQTMLFSATLSYYVLRLACDYMKDPLEVRIESDSVAIDKIDQSLLHLGRAEKMNYLINLILEHKKSDTIKTIVFTNLKTMVPVIADKLRSYGIAATGISSLLEQNKRIRLLKDFKLGKYEVLVATDVASRGIDVDDISHVFNYDLPSDGESYVHRIGRTARAGKSGVSISFCSEADYKDLPRIERYLGGKIAVKEINESYLETPHGIYTPLASEFSDGERGDRQRKTGRRGQPGSDRERGSKNVIRADFKKRPARGKPGRESLDQEERPGQEQSQQDRPQQDRPRQDRPRQDRPRQDRPRQDRPRQDRPRQDRHGQERSRQGMAANQATGVRDADRAALLGRRPGDDQSANVKEISEYQKSQSRRGGPRNERDQNGRTVQRDSVKAGPKTGSRTGPKTHERTKSKTDRYSDSREGSGGGQRRERHRSGSGSSGKRYEQSRYGNTREKRETKTSEKKGLLGKILGLFSK